jgi:Na+-transporting NADH:ubiquinone oxidoreductase subunit B
MSPWLQSPAADVTRVAPHIRSTIDLAWVTRAVLVALVPGLAVGLYNTGYQANHALALLGLETIEGWRGTVLVALGVGYDEAAVPACVLHGALYFLPLFGVALVTGALWERVFAVLRKRRASTGLVLVAALFTLSLPPTLPLWQAVLGMSFGIVVGREIFGGTGRNVIHPALAGLAFLYFSYPAAMKGDGVWVAVAGYPGATALAVAAAGGLEAITEAGTSWSQSFFGRIPGALGQTSTVACLLGAAYLIHARVASWRIMLGALLGLSATALLLGWTSSAAFPVARLPWYWHLSLGSFAFGTIFLATDPVTSPATDAGRWIHGLLIGFLVVLIRAANPLHPEGTMLAILLGSIFAPLIDHGVVRVNVRRRRRRLQGGSA